MLMHVRLHVLSVCTSNSNETKYTFKQRTWNRLTLIKLLKYDENTLKKIISLESTTCLTLWLDCASRSNSSVHLAGNAQHRRSTEWRLAPVSSICHNLAYHVGVLRIVHQSRRCYAARVPSFCSFCSCKAAWKQLFSTTTNQLQTTLRVYLLETAPLSTIVELSGAIF